VTHSPSGIDTLVVVQGVRPRLGERADHCLVLRARPNACYTGFGISPWSRAQIA